MINTYDARELYKYVENEQKQLAICLTEKTGKYAGVIFTVDFENMKITDMDDGSGDSRFEFAYQIIFDNGLGNLEKDEELADIIGKVFTAILTELVEDIRRAEEAGLTEELNETQSE